MVLEVVLVVLRGGSGGPGAGSDVGPQGPSATTPFATTPFSRPDLLLQLLLELLLLQLRVLLKLSFRLVVQGQVLCC